MTTRELAEQSGLGISTIERNIKTLREAGFIERIGGRKDGYWQYSGE